MAVAFQFKFQRHRIGQAPHPAIPAIAPLAVAEVGDPGRTDPVEQQVGLIIDGAIQVLARMSDKDAKGGTKDGIVDARMVGYRVAAALPPTSVKGPSICIRKHSPLQLKLQDYVRTGGITAVFCRVAGAGALKSRLGAVVATGAALTEAVLAVGADVTGAV